MTFSEFEVMILHKHERKWRLTLPTKFINQLSWSKGDKLLIGISKPMGRIPPVIGIFNLSQAIGEQIKWIESALGVPLGGIGIDETRFSEWWIQEAEKLKKTKTEIEQQEFKETAAKAKKVKSE